jgi:hypothetical protein
MQTTDMMEYKVSGNSSLYLLLEKKMEEVNLVSPQNLGMLTPLYKKTTAYLKISPWKILLPASFILCVLAQLTMGHLMIKTASVLQSAF